MIRDAQLPTLSSLIIFNWIHVHSYLLKDKCLDYNWISSKSKGHNSVKNGMIVPKTELGLDILLINLYTKFHYSMCNGCEENERKLSGPTDSSNAICPPFLKGDIKINKSHFLSNKSREKSRKTHFV